MRRGTKYALAILISLQACGGPTPIPGPSPSPAPAPAPSPTPPPEPALGWPTLLNVVGEDFHRHGKVVLLLGYGGVCCNVNPGVNLWPWISETLLREAAAHGLNFVHIRLGPNAESLEPRPDMRPLLDRGSLDDVEPAWNPAFFGGLNHLLDLAFSLGVYLEIDVIDGWELKTPRYSAFPAGMNDCSILLRSPQTVHRRWIRKVVAELGHHENILWQISNESGKCPPLGTTIEWENGVAAEIMNSETANDFLHHPIGTNGEIRKADRSSMIDYINTHQSVAAEQTGANKPVTVNEYNPFIGVAEFRNQLDIAARNHTIFHLWVSDATEDERRAALDVIQQFRKDHTP